MNMNMDVNIVIDYPIPTSFINLFIYSLRLFPASELLVIACGNEYPS